MKYSDRKITVTPVQLAGICANTGLFSCTLVASGYLWWGYGVAIAMGLLHGVSAWYESGHNPR